MTTRLFAIRLILFLCSLISCKDNKKLLDCNDLIVKLNTEVSTQNNVFDSIKKLTEIEVRYNLIKCSDLETAKGILYAKCNKLENAKKSFIKSLIIKQKNFEASGYLGLIYYDEKKFDSAIIYLGKAFNLKSSNGFVFNENENLGSVSGSLLSMQKIGYFLGKSHYFMRNFLPALKYFNYCIESNYKLSDVYLYRGSMYIETKDYENGCKDFKMAKAHANVEVDTYIKKYCSQ